MSAWILGFIAVSISMFLNLRSTLRYKRFQVEAVQDTRQRATTTTMKFSPSLETWRQRHGPHASATKDPFGFFVIPGPKEVWLRVMASSDEDWEHVSVTLGHRAPKMKEMWFIKDLFWDPRETVVQLYPVHGHWITNDPYCLHLWRPLRESVPMPSSIPEIPKPNITV
jgi:hypothetical protein